jgi:hypothetical protein
MCQTFQQKIQQNSKYYYNNDDKNHNKNKTDITEFFLN